MDTGSREGKRVKAKKRESSIWFNQNQKALVALGGLAHSASQGALTRWFDRDNRGEPGRPCRHSPAAVGNLLVDYSLARRQDSDLMRRGRHSSLRECKS